MQELLSVFMNNGYQESSVIISQLNKNLNQKFKENDNIVNIWKEQTCTHSIPVSLYFKNRLTINIREILKKKEKCLYRAGLEGSCYGGNYDLFEITAKEVIETAPTYAVEIFTKTVGFWEHEDFKDVISKLDFSDDPFYCKLYNHMIYCYSGRYKTVILQHTIENCTRFKGAVVENVRWMIDSDGEVGIVEALCYSIKFQKSEITDYLETLNISSIDLNPLFFLVILNWSQGFFDDEYATSEIRRLVRLNKGSQYEVDTLNRALEYACRNTVGDLVEYLIDNGADYCKACETEGVLHDVYGGKMGF
jgi:hypothetical protein